MNNTEIAQVGRYLTELEAALAERAVADRDDILASVRDHIESALGDDDVSEADVAQVLTQLGDPLAIAAEAADPDVSDPLDRGARPRWSARWVPAAVIALIMISSVLWAWFLPLITLAAGIVLLWGSALWTPGEKLAGTVLLPAPAVAWWGLGIGSVADEMCVAESTGVEVGSGQAEQVDVVCEGGTAVWESVVGTGLLVAAVLGGVMAAVLLYRRGMTRAHS
ncbi:DUF1700 domain-containing protein [Phytoactinopolyspora limicola]|uniref:DUF1700 domain-containing protein n=1 Tax=Phytoactinopolyspora limicola TaxID=2715536 RepID=UPI001407F810|nr:hypothetical protein [Phytoactinopolyspora limicola]